MRQPLSDNVPVSRLRAMRTVDMNRRMGFSSLGTVARNNTPSVALPFTQALVDGLRSSA